MKVRTKARLVRVSWVLFFVVAGVFLFHDVSFQPAGRIPLLVVRGDIPWFEGKTFTITGVVTDASQQDAKGQVLYRMTENGAELWVIGSAPLPTLGKKYAVKGSFHSTWKIRGAVEAPCMIEVHRERMYIF